MKKHYFLFLLTFISFTGFSQSAGDIVVTEFMNDSDAVSDTVGEWLEIYNTTGSPIDLNGWSLKDDGSNLYTFSVSVVVPANSYFVLGRGPADPSQNGGVNLDFSYGDNYTLGNSADEIILLSPTDVEIDRVNYGIGGFPDGGPGFSISLDPTQLTGDNNLATNWCLSTSTFGDGDKGTPGAVNDVCAPVCEANLGAHDATCDASTAGTDTYTVSLAFSGAGTTTFSVTAVETGTMNAVGTVGGDDPTSNASGNITVSGIPEGTNITITMDDTGNGGLCTLTRDVTSPTCVPTGSVDLELKGVIDFDLSSSDGKAVHVVATDAIADLSVYGLGIANNGGGTDGQEYTFDAIAVASGANILVVRNATAMEAYLTTAAYNLFDHVLVDAGGSVSQNGDDAIELFKNGSVVETFGDIDTDGSGEAWEYVDSWAYKTTAGASWPTGWSYGGPDCTDNTTTIFDSSCVYPFVESLSTDDNRLELVGLYPNPVSIGNSFVTVKTKSDGVMQVVIYDLLGKQLKSQNVTNNQVDISGLKTGIYMLKITQANKQVSKRIIIQ